MDSLLLVEDDAAIAESLLINLKVNGYEVTHVGTIKAASALLEKKRFQLLLFDVNLPDGSGFDLCQRVRVSDATTPIILLTAKTDEDSVVKGLGAGATDYIRKPFGMKELLARMKRLMNRDVYAASHLSYKSLKINVTDRRVLYETTELSLTKREFEILALLVKRAGSLVAKEHVLDAIDREGNMFDGTLSSHISNLRTKLKIASKDQLRITAVYGHGYRIEKK